MSVFRRFLLWKSSIARIKIDILVVSYHLVGPCAGEVNVIGLVLLALLLSIVNRRTNFQAKGYMRLPAFVNDIIRSTSGISLLLK